MASSTNILCGICDAQHITKCADHWCPECDEGLCYDCEKHHSISKDKITTVRDLQNNIVAMKNHATDLQTFLASKKLEERAMLEEKYLQSILIDSNSLKCLNLKCSISDNIMHIPAIKSFGSISTHVSASSAVLTTEKDKQAQILYHRKHFCQNGDMVFAEYFEGNRLLIMNSMGNLRREISLPSIHPYDVTSIDDNTVAVTTWYQNGIHVVDINSGTITAHISGDFCGGITRRGNTLICGVRSNELKAVDLRDNAVSALIPEVPINCQTYVTTTSDKIFVTHHANNTVTCYRMNGDKEWQYVDQSMVNVPLGITVDKYENVYVISNGNNSVVLITSDGKHARKILEEKDGIVCPYCVHFDPNQNNLLVACFNGGAFLYNIS
ncbi:unnamed protein product [Mytilus edulis]|uniref:B box-type domain-containing protein n=1 Tax=Mytilus edulis TaxID=6550 RepID=A0A8S3QVR5_MYTED|nr:unnamed protein product [Mytilus edulis]